MPTLGEIRFAYEIGIRAGEGNRQKLIWARCTDCAVERWVFVLYGKPKYEKCHKCATKYDHKSPRGVLAKGTINNPVEGDVRFGDELAHKTGNKYIWRVCIGCGNGKWVQLKGDKPNNPRCCKCAQLNISDIKRKPKIQRGLSAKGTINNPILGDIRYGDEIGRIPTQRFVWRVCSICQKPIGWIGIKLGRIPSDLCQQCRNKKKSASNSCKWKGGEHTSKFGYHFVYIGDDSPFYSMVTMKLAQGGYILEHRLIMAQYIGRPLANWEVVHHKNHNRIDNRIENLELFITPHHEGLTILENKLSNITNRIKGLEETIEEQNKTISLLFWHIVEMNKKEANNVTTK